MTIEQRGVTCIGCINLDLKQAPDAAKTGYGKCLIDPPGVFVRIEMSRNCASFAAAPVEIVTARELWAAKIPLPDWQR